VHFSQNAIFGEEITDTDSAEHPLPIIEIGSWARPYIDWKRRRYEDEYDIN
jgi:hypothetical protein